MFDHHPKLPTRKQAVGAVKGAAVEVARPVGAVVGVVIGALAAKTLASKQPVRKAAKGGRKRKTRASRHKRRSGRTKKR